jgi:hypothetical protein
MWWLLAVIQLGAARPADSVAVHKAARAAQAEFEFFRVAHLPWSRGESHWGRCDVVVGRFCFWFAEDPGWRPSPESPAIARARLALAGALDSLGALLPGDGWIAGQRVRYLVEAGDTGRALAAARDCRASAWWCDALAGYALDRARRYAPADSAFTAALAAMPPEQRCRWADLSDVLDGLRGAYRKLQCTDRDSLARRIWWLADPLYLVPGNERRSEHFARRVIATLQQDARSAYDVRWGHDLDQLTLRYGWPIAWERERPEPYEIGAPTHILSHNDPRSWHFLPPARFVESPAAIRPGAWNLKPDRPRSSYEPPYATAFHELPHQLAVFRRGDSIVVVAGYDVRAPEDSARRADRIRRVQAALVLQRGPDVPRLMVGSTGSAPAGVLLALAPAESTLVSLETLDTADSTHAARARFWLPVTPAGGVALSDPLLFRVERPDSLPLSLGDAVGLALGSPRLSPGERVGVFWETYGLASHPEPFRVTLTVAREGEGLLQRIVAWAGLARHDDRYVSLGWEEPSHPEAVVYPRALALSLPEAGPGRYRLDITLQMHGQPIARSTRELEIAEHEP